MDNGIETSVDNQKGGKGKTFIIILLIFLLLVACGYIAYDKVLIKKIRKHETTEMQEEKSAEKALTDDIALGFGKYLYDYATKNLFNICALGDEGSMIYNDGNIKTIDSNYIYQNGDTSAALIRQEKIDILAATALENFKKQKGVMKIDNKYYVVGDFGDCQQGRMKDFAEIKVRNITNGKIEYDVTEYYCKDINDYSKCEAKDTDSLNEIKTVFVVVKVGDQWKISQYEDAYQKNYELNNN